jgi:hypothetical protein
MKKAILLFCALMGLGVMTYAPSNAEAYWGYREYRSPGPIPDTGFVKVCCRFRPRFSMTLSGGLHFVDALEDGTTPLTYAMAELGTHLWIHPNLSIDLNLGTHFITDDIDGHEWGYFSIKPGIRAKFGIFYLRGALDIALTNDRGARHKRPVLFGFLIGAGIRVPVARRVRLFAELDYQFLFADVYYMPFYGQTGIEVVF